MNTAEAIQRVYHWACQVRQDRHSTMVMLRAATAVLRIIDDRKSDAAGYDKIVEQLDEWKPREFMAPTIKAIQRAMGG